MRLSVSDCPVEVKARHRRRRRFDTLNPAVYPQNAMLPLRLTWTPALLLAILSFGRGQTLRPVDPKALARSLCFAGDHFDVLYVTDGTRVFARRLKVRGFAPWAPVAAVPTQGPG